MGRTAVVLVVLCLQLVACADGSPGVHGRGPDTTPAESDAGSSRARDMRPLEGPDAGPLPWADAGATWAWDAGAVDPEDAGPMLVDAGASRSDAGAGPVQADAGTDQLDAGAPEESDAGPSTSGDAGPPVPPACDIARECIETREGIPMPSGIPWGAYEAVIRDCVDVPAMMEQHPELWLCLLRRGGLACWDAELDCEAPQPRDAGRRACLESGGGLSCFDRRYPTPAD